MWLIPSGRGDVAFLTEARAVMSSAKKNNSTVGDIMARTDTLVGEEGGPKKAVMLAVYGALMVPRTLHK